MAKLGKLVVDLIAETLSFQRDMKKAAEETTKFQQNVTKMGKAVVGAFAGFLTIDMAVRAISALGRAGIEAERSQLRLAGVLRATGGAAGMSAEEIARFAEAMQRSTLFDDEQIKDAAAALATFRSVQGETFREALRLSADMSSIFGQDMRSSVVQLGKALEMPREGLTALRRIGVTFSEQQRAQIDELLEQNRLFEAQREILNGVAAQLGGTAEAMAGSDSLLGASNRLTDAWDDMLERIASTPASTSLAARAFNALADALNSIAPDRATRIAQLQRELAALEGPFKKSPIGLLSREEIFARDAMATGRAAQMQEELNQLLREEGRAAGEAIDAFMRSSVARERVGDATRALTEEQEKLFASLRQARTEFGMSAAEVELYRLELAGATPAMIAFARETLALKAAQDLNAEAFRDARKNRHTLAEANADVAARMNAQLREEAELREQILDTIRTTAGSQAALAGVLEEMDTLRFRMEGLFTDALAGELRGVDDFARRVVAIFARMSAELAAMRLSGWLFGEVGSTAGGVLGSAIGGAFRAAGAGGGASRVVAAGSGGGALTVVNNFSTPIYANDAASFAQQLKRNPDTFAEMFLDMVRTNRAITAYLGAELRGAGAL